MAAVVGKPRTWSPRLRQGIADTAAFLGGYATDEVLRDRLTGKLHARRVVAAVTDNANADATGRAWQSLTDVLPLLAEASPDTFLDPSTPTSGVMSRCCVPCSSTASSRRSGPRRCTSP